jgi:hypothetical protein
MIAGGTLNTRVIQNDLNQIESGQFYASNLIRLPLLANFREVDPHYTANGPSGGRPDLSTDNKRNPIVNNIAGGVAIRATRIQIQQPANCLQLLWHALDANGNYYCSFPLNDPNNYAGDGIGYPATPLDLTATGSRTWAFGWLRINGIGPWFPMSLLPTMQWINTTVGTAIAGYLDVFPFGGFASISAPMAFVDWVGYWSNLGSAAAGPMGDNHYILACTSINLSVSSHGNAMGMVQNYATPSGSGVEPQPSPTDTQRNQDILVRSGRG